MTGAATSKFSGETPFTVNALFDTASPNIAAPVGVPGFVAYSPYAVTMTVGGKTYNVQTYNQNPATGVTVAVYDNTTPFGIEPCYRRQPLRDWPAARPACGRSGSHRRLGRVPRRTLAPAHLVSTTFTDYVGVGYASGYVTSRDPMGAPLTNAIVPIPLTDAAGNPYLLTLGNYDAEAASSPLNTASLQATPEPGALAFLASGLLGGALFLRKRKK